MSKNKKQNIHKSINANSIRLVGFIYASILIFIFTFISPQFKILYSQKRPLKYTTYLSLYTNNNIQNSIKIMMGSRLREVGVTFLLYRNNMFYTKLQSDVFTDQDLIPYNTYSYQIIAEQNNNIVYKSNILNVVTQNPQINNVVNHGNINYSVYSAFGDSITQGYDTSVSYFNKVSSFLKEKYNTQSFNDGVGGNTTYNLLQRINGELQNQNPTLVTLMIGTNDLRLGTKQNPAITPLEYKQNLIQILNTINPSAKRTVIIFLIPYLENFNFPLYSAGSYQRLEQFNNIIIGVANTFGIPYINENNSLEKQNNVLAPDKIHPNNKGDSIIAALLISKLAQI